MKLDLVSDVHLEFGNMPVPKGGEVLVLAGDIHVGLKALDWIEECLKRYDQVYYVLGNHEFYNHEYHSTVRAWLEIAGKHENLEVLHNMVHAYNGVRFLGTTLWTPALRYGLKDYIVIKYANRILEPSDTQALYYEAQQFLTDALAQPWAGETVVITHHAPVPECVVPKYAGDSLNENFHCNLNYMIAENDIAFWLHGHMHDSIFIEQDGTVIVCNPRGYVGYGANHGFQNPLTLEI